MTFVLGIFDESEVTGNLLTSWIKHKAELDAERLQPYADLLLDELVWPTMLIRKDSIAAALKAKCQTVGNPHELSVPIWTFNHCFDYPKRTAWPGGPPHRFALERGDENAVKVQQIYERGWHQWVEVTAVDDYGEESVIYEHQPVWYVVKKTHFLEELALRFGRDYRISVSTAPMYADGGDGELLYSVVTLNLHYFPFGLPDHHLKTQQEVIEKLATKERRTLASGESLTFWRGAPVALLGNDWTRQRIPHPVCHCGCGEDDDE